MVAKSNNEHGDVHLGPRNCLHGLYKIALSLTPLIQCKPLIVITLGPCFSDHTKRTITMTKDFNYLVLLNM